MLTENKLKDYAIDFLKDNFNIDLYIPIKQNNRLRSTLGRYVMNGDGKPLRIEIAGNVLKYGSDDTVLGILRHECIHYAYHVLGKDMRDGDPEFERALKRFKAPSTKTLKVGKFYVFKCVRCQKQGETKIKRLVKNPQLYRTNCCKEKLEIVGETIYQG